MKHRRLLIAAGAVAAVLVAGTALAAFVPPIRQAVTGAVPALNGVLPGTMSFRVDGPTMEPALHPGETVPIQSYGSAHPQRWDIVVFHPPSNPQLSYISRIVGLPGEIISVTQHGETINGHPLNGHPLNDPYLPLAGNGGIVNAQPLTLGPGEYFVMGDNRADSGDSRLFGPVALSAIVGKVAGVAS